MRPILPDKIRLYYRAVFSKQNKFIGLETSYNLSDLRGTRKDENKFAGEIWSELRFKR